MTIHRSNHESLVNNKMKNPVEKRKKVKFKLSPWVIPFTDYSIHGPMSNNLHGPFHSRTKVKLSLRTIPFIDQIQTISPDHSIHRPNLNHLHGPFPDQSQTIATDHSIHRPFHSQTKFKTISTPHLQTKVTYLYPTQTNIT